MAVTKLKAYNSEEAIENALDYMEDQQKVLFDVEKFAKDANPDGIIDNALQYSVNNFKTTLMGTNGEAEVLVSSVHCKVSLAAETFKRTADEYHRNGHQENVGKRYHAKTLFRAKLGSDGNPVLDREGNMIYDKYAPVYHDENGDTITFEEERVNKARTCYMWVMSFPPAYLCGYEIDPRLIHQIGREFVEELERETGLQFPAVISTHLDKDHRHNHILHSAYALDGHHKYVDTMETLMKAREISDRLSLKYDLPIIMEPENGHSMSWQEWKLAQEGKSWKDTIRKEVEYALENSSDYKGFVRRMEQSGFVLRETEKGITYYTPGKKHRCRDVGLGEAYTKEAILRYYEQMEQERKKEVPKKKEVIDIEDPALVQNNQQPLRIYVSRYTARGRKRSELEMLLLKAIKLIKALGDRFTKEDESSQNPVYRKAAWKADRLSEAISILKTYGIETKTDLESKLTEVGAAYSHAKKDYSELNQSYEGLCTLKELLENISEMQMIADSLGINELFLSSVTDKEISENRAALFPMTPSQKRELFLALEEHPMYKVNAKYSSLTYREAKECIDFLKGKSDVQPPALGTTLERQSNLKAKYQAIAEKTLAGMDERLEGRPITDALKKTLEGLDISIDLNTLTLSQGIHLAAYFKPWNPQFVPNTNLDEQPTPARVAQLSELLAMQNKKLNIPVHQLSKKDADVLFRDLCLAELTPDIVKQNLERQWNESLFRLSYEERGYAEEYRNLVKQLASLGYSLSDKDALLSEISAQLAGISEAKESVTELSQEYKVFKQLSMYTTLAETKQFTYGPKWDEILQKVEEIETERETEPEPEEEQPRKKFSKDVDVDL